MISCLFLVRYRSLSCMRPALTFGILATVVSIAIAAETAPVHNIGITADVPTVTVSPRRPDRTTIRIPGLTYEMSLTVDCEANWRPDSVSISVADSRASLNAEQLQVSRELGLELRIPSNQIAPLRVEHFCTGTDIRHSSDCRFDRDCGRNGAGAQHWNYCGRTNRHGFTATTRPYNHSHSRPDL